MRKMTEALEAQAKIMKSLYALMCDGQGPKLIMNGTVYKYINDTLIFFCKFY